MHASRKILIGLLLGGVSAVIAISLEAVGGLERFEFFSWDQRARRLAAPADDRIRLILLDQGSLDWGRENHELTWPWDRQVYSYILEFCRQAEAKAVVFDFFFTEPQKHEDDDIALAEAIAQTPSYVGSLILRSGASGRTDWPEEAVRAYRWRDEKPAPPESWRQNGATFNIPRLTAVTRRFGHVVGHPDVDGVFRRYLPVGVFAGQPVPALGLAAEEFSQIGVAPGRVQLGERALPLDPDGHVVLRYRRPRSGEAFAYPAHPASAVIESALALQEGMKPPIDPALFKDAYVFFGASAAGLHDWKVSPMDARTVGVEIQATALDNFLNGDAPRVLPAGVGRVAVALLAVLAALAILFTRSAIPAVAVTAIFWSLPMGVGFAAYAAGLWTPVASPTLSGVLAVMGALAVNYATEGRQKRFIRRAFGHYLSPAVIEEITRNPGLLRLGGERRELTIFFSDLAGFSAIAEKMDPQVLTSLLNEYLTDMTDIVLEEGGTLDKYVGDAIVAFWNAPLSQPDHALRACRAALRCQQRLDARRAEWKERTGVELGMRIGIHTGLVVVGNMGSTQRFDYTVLGDAANLASRLEGANKYLGSRIMVTRATWQSAREHHTALTGRRLGSIRVVGRQEAVEVYEPLGLGPMTFEDEKRAENFALLADLAREGRWEEMLELLEKYPQDAVAETYRRRVRAAAGGEEAGWDGVWNLEGK